MAVDLFISYASADRELQGELAKHLSGLRNLGIIKDWFNGDIVEGKEWKPELLHHLNTAHIILLLVSADFVASKFCYQIEMQRALERHNAGLACVIPIILHPTDWKQLPFGKLQALPADAKPVSMWRNRHEAFVTVVEGIKRAIKDLQDTESSTADKTEDKPIHIDSNRQKSKATGHSAQASKFHNEFQHVNNVFQGDNATIHIQQGNDQNSA
jgi:hypothetical protein